MSQLIQLKHRIRAIQKTQKITRAMRLIAMSLYSKLEHNRDTLSKYIELIRQCNIPLIQQNPDKSDLFFPENVHDSRPLIIICTSTKSLCGGLNNNLLKYFEENFFAEEHQDPRFIVIGNKAADFISSRYKDKVLLSVTDLNMNNLGETSSKIMKIICDATPHYTSVIAYYNFLKNFFIQEPLKEQLIPLNLNDSQKDEATDATKASENVHETTTYEQDIQTIAFQAARQSVAGLVTHALFQNLISENAARFIAMDNSTNNAKKYLESLGLIYNKSRQSIITREISELASNL